MCYVKSAEYSAAEVQVFELPVSLTFFVGLYQTVIFVLSLVRENKVLVTLAVFIAEPHCAFLDYLLHQFLFFFESLHLLTVKFAFSIVSSD